MNSLSPDRDGCDVAPRSLPTPGTPAPFHVARDPVGLAAIRRWCDAMGDRNPVHTEPGLATRSRFGEIVAPLAMLDVWTKPGLAYVRDVDDPQGGAFASLDAEGYTASVAVTTELTQARPLIIGDLVASTIELASVSDEKQTALGAGRFVTTRQVFVVDGDEVGVARFTVLKYRPRPTSTGTAAPAPADTTPGDPSAVSIAPGGRDPIGTLVAPAVAIGEPIPTDTVAVTTTSIVAGALMTSDYFAAHHDRDDAHQRGMPDIFMNIHTTVGIVSAHVGNHLGPNARWRSVGVRLGVPVHPGDRLRLDGECTAIDHRTGAATVTARAVCDRGTHASATIEVDLPIK